MTDSETTRRPSKLKLAVYLLLAVAIALSWLGLVFFVDADPTGFALSSGDEQNTELDEPVENVSVDELRETLTRTDRGGESTVSMTAIWATETYFRAAGLDTESYEVSLEDNHVFLVFLDTHTGSLPQMDWENDAQLQVDETTYEAAGGHTYAGGFHHLVAVVEFPRTVEGTPTLAEGTDEVTLSITGVERNEPDIDDDRTRTLTWTYPPPYFDADPGAFEDSECDCASLGAQTTGGQ